MPGFDRIEPVVGKVLHHLDFRLRQARRRAMACHGVISAGAQTPESIVGKLEVAPPSFSNHSRYGTLVMPRRHIHGSSSLMQPQIEPLGPVIISIMYFGDVVFAVSGALVAARHRMDVLGIIVIGAVTAIGGGTLRDVLLGHPVSWVQSPNELILCLTAAMAAYLVRRVHVPHQGAAVWADALGLAAFAVTGAHIALESGVPIIVAAFLGMLTATGGGVVRDLLTQTRPMILTGEIYATAALVGATVYALLSRYVLTEELAGPVAFAIALAIRGAAVLFGLRFGVAGEPIIVARRRPP